MCLILDEAKTKRIKASKSNKPIVAYKELVESPFIKGTFVSPYQDWQFGQGKNKSGRLFTDLSKKELKEKEIIKGFHCYVSLKDLINRRMRFGSYKERAVFKVKIDRKDLVAYGMFGKNPSLVCTKLTIDLKNPCKME